MFKSHRRKINDLKFKRYLLDNLIDEEGNKVSVRKLIESKKFMDYTGLYQEDEKGNRKPCSMGTIQYYLSKDKYDLNENFLFNYHREKGNIKKDVSYSEWSNLKNRGKKAVKNKFSDEVIFNSFISYFSDILPKEAYNYTLEFLKEHVIKSYDNAFGVGEGNIEIENFYDALLRGGDEDGD